MILDKYDFNFDDFDQITDRKTKIGEHQVSRGRLIRIPKSLISVRLAVKEELEVVDSENDETYDINSGLYNWKFDHYELLDSDGNAVNEDHYSIDYSAQEITLTADLSEGTYDFYYLPQQGNFEIRCVSPERISSQESIELVGDDLTIAHQIDQTKEGSGFKPNRKVHLPEHFKIQLFANTERKIEFETDLTRVELMYNQTTMDNFLRNMQQQVPEATKKDIPELILQRWQRN